MICFYFWFEPAKKLAIMKYLLYTGRAFYAIAILLYGFHQFYFGSFRDVFFSVYQQHLPFLSGFAYLFGLYLVGTAVLILIPATGKRASLVLGAVWLVLFFGTQLTYELISEPNKLYHL